MPIEIYNNPKANSNSPKKEELGSGRSVFILIGPPTSGKTSLATGLAERTGAVRITGRGISESIDPDLTGRLESERRLMPDAEFIPVLEEILLGIDCGNVVFDNVPRTKEQAEVVKKWAEERGYELKVVSLELTEDQVVNRALERTSCPTCGASYHPKLKPSNEPGICDIDGSPLVARKGDGEETLRRGYGNFINFREAIVNSLESKATIYNIRADGTTVKTLEEVSDRLSL